VEHLIVLVAVHIFFVHRFEHFGAALDGRLCKCFAAAQLFKMPDFSYLRLYFLSTLSMVSPSLISRMSIDLSFFLLVKKFEC